MSGKQEWLAPFAEFHLQARTVDDIVIAPILSVTVPAAVAFTAPGPDVIPAIRGDTFRRTLDGLGDLTSAAELWFTVKLSADDPDSASVIQVSSIDGLLTINGAAAGNAALGSIVITNAAGGVIQVSLDETVTALLTPGNRLRWGAKVRIGADTTTVRSGQFELRRGVMIGSD